MVSELKIQTDDSLLNQNFIKESVNISIKTAKYYNSSKTNLYKNDEKLVLKQLTNKVSKFQSNTSSSSNSLSESSSSSSDEEENKCSSFSFFTSASQEAQKKLIEKDKINSSSFGTSICLETNKANNFKQLDNLKDEDFNLAIYQKANNLNVDVFVDSNIEKCINSKNDNLNNSDQPIFKDDAYNFIEKTQINKIKDNLKIIQQEKVNLKSVDNALINNCKEINKTTDNLSTNEDSNFYLNTIFENSLKNASETTNLVLNNQIKKNLILEKNAFSHNKKTEEDNKKFEDELLQKMREEEETAVMNLNDFDCFGANYFNSTSTKIPDSNEIPMKNDSVKNLTDKKVGTYNLTFYYVFIFN